MRYCPEIRRAPEGSRMDVLMTTKKLSVAKSAAKAAIFTFIVLAASCDQTPKYATSIELSARPGAVVIVPYDQPVRGKRQSALGYIPARVQIDPKPIPQGARVVYQSIGLHGSGDIAGDLLLQVPLDAEGEIKFSLSAFGQGNQVMGGSAAFFSTEDINVSIKVAGQPITEVPPELEGEWSDGDRTWIIQQGDLLVIKKRRADSEEKTSKAQAFSDGNGRWFLIELGGANAYWIEYEKSGTLLISHPGDMFDPFIVLARE